MVDLGHVPHCGAPVCWQGNEEAQLKGQPAGPVGAAAMDPEGLEAPGLVT